MHRQTYGHTVKQLLKHYNLAPVCYAGCDKLGSVTDSVDFERGASEGTWTDDGQEYGQTNRQTHID